MFNCFDLNLYILQDPFLVYFLTLSAELLWHRSVMFLFRITFTFKKNKCLRVFALDDLPVSKTRFHSSLQKNILREFLSGSLSGGGRNNRLKPQGVLCMLAECSSLLTSGLCTKQHGYAVPLFLISTHWLLLLHVLRSVSWMPDGDSWCEQVVEGIDCPVLQGECWL